MLISEAVTRICEALGDPNLQRYANSTTYVGLAMDTLQESILSLMRDPETPQEDVHGYLQKYAVTITDGVADLSTINSKKVLRVIGWYRDPDDSNTVNKVLKDVTNKELAQVMDTTLMSSLTDLLYVYRVGKNLIFYPKSNVGTGKKITVSFIEEPTAAYLETHTNDLSDNLSLNLQIKAIRIATNILLQDRNK